jgi:hypothetical protein
MHPQAFIKFVGDLIDSLGGYLAVRFLIPDREAVRRTIKVLAVVCMMQGLFMVSEQFTRQNVLGFLGAASPAMREGHIRSEGVLGALHGGTLAGVLMPMFVLLWNERKSRLAACAGLAGSTAMVWASHASTSALACGASLLALAFWPLRKRMRLVRWGIVAMLVGLHLVMNGPVWSLIEHIDVTGGSSSYHRYMLVDNCIRHFSDWWLLGYKDYGSWGFDMWDLCNQYVSVALTGGLISLVCYIAIFSRSFGFIGNARKLVDGDRRQEWFLWCLGSVLFAHVVAYFGINCTVELLLLFFALLTWISVTTRDTGQMVVPAAETLDEVHFPTAAALPDGVTVQQFAR